MNVRVYTTKICPYCDRAKLLLKTRGIPYEEIDLTDNADLRSRLTQENGGWRTVPMIFIGAEFIGGYTELAALEKGGRLDAKVRGP